MKKDWTYKKLGEVTTKCANISWTKVNSEIEYSYVDLASVNRDNLQIEDTQNVNALSAPSRAKQIIHQGDVLFGTTRPTLKRVCIVPEDYDGQICSTGFCVLRPNKTVITEWIFYNLCANNFYDYIESLQTGANYPAVSDTIVKSFSIPIPPISIQRSIVSELDLLHSVISKKKEQLRELDNLAQSLFYQMFGDPITNPMGWEKVPISVHVADKKTIKRASKRFAGSDEIEYIDISSINNQSHVITDTTNYIFNEAPSRAQQCVAYGDILISLVRPNLKNIAVVCDNRENLVASSGFCVLRVKETACLLFLKQILLSDYFTQYLLTRVSGANYPAVHESDILDYQIITPPLSLQQSFAAKVSAIEEQKRFISQSIKDVESLLAQRMDQYFSSLPVSVLPPVVHDGSK